ncbi:pre-mrna-splicing factor rse1 [Moniliophthora roreri]|nr:pre-mrna-splicing factor rse1 [Moniliophthora roreri]
MTFVGMLSVFAGYNVEEQRQNFIVRIRAVRASSSCLHDVDQPTSWLTYLARRGLLGLWRHLGLKYQTKSSRSWVGRSEMGRWCQTGIPELLPSLVHIRLGYLDNIDRPYTTPAINFTSYQLKSCGYTVHIVLWT